MMGLMGNYQQTQNGQNEGIVLAHTVAGSPVQGVGGVQHAQGDVALAVGNQMRPYQPPKRRKHDSPDTILCSFEECKAFPMKSTGYCAGHSNKLGLVKFTKGGRNKDGSYPKKEVVDGDTE